MLNFKMSKLKQQEILNKCNFTDEEKYIFNNLVEGKKRKDIYVLAYENLNLSISTTKRRIKDISIKMQNCAIDENISYKVYMHIFPNGKKYVGVCQCCKDRWNNGKGYALNTKMYEDIQKYGWDNIEHKILLETIDSHTAYSVERILIEELNLIENGYNNI